MVSGSAEDGEVDAADARQADDPGRAAREIDRPAGDERAAVRDPDDDRAAGGGAGHSHPSPEPKRLVRGGEPVLIEPRAVGRAPAVEAGAVPGGDFGMAAPDRSREHEAREGDPRREAQEHRISKAES